MKLVMDEKLKHRLIGLAVVISIAAIFAPAIMRKSSQRLEGNFSENVTLPSKPKAPNVVITDEKDVFKTIKVARIQLPAESNDNQLPEIAKAQPLDKQRSLDRETVEVAQTVPVVKPLQLAFTEQPKMVSKNKEMPSKPSVKVKSINVAKQKMPNKPTAQLASKKDMYSVQLGSLSRLSNANDLVNRLKAKGYKANVVKVATSRGVVYKVYAGRLPHKEEALRLRTQLASAMQINGFVVNTGVS